MIGMRRVLGLWILRFPPRVIILLDNEKHKVRLERDLNVKQDSNAAYVSVVCSHPSVWFFLRSFSHHNPIHIHRRACTIVY